MAIHARPPVDEWVVFLDFFDDLARFRQIQCNPKYERDLQPGLNMCARKVVDDRACEERVR
jgi:hypothetical protein